KIYELIVGDHDQYVRLGGFEIGAQYGECRFGVLAKFLLLRERRPARRTLGRHTVVKIHEIFPLPARFKKDVGSMARCQSGIERHNAPPRVDWKKSYSPPAQKANVRFGQISGS